jgi:hypothetical protein
MAKFNTSLINTAIDSAFASADTYSARVEELQRLLKGADRETVKDYVAPRAAKRYGAEYVDGKWTDSDCAAKRYTNRLVSAILGQSSPRKEARAVAAPAKLTKHIVDQIIEAGITRAEFDALLAAVRDGIAFE